MSFVDLLSDEERSVLIVDDDRDILEGLVAILESEGFDVTTAETVAGALDHIAKYDFGIYLLDISLPDENGIQLLKHVNTSNHNSLKIMLTGKTETEDVVDALNNGADHLLLKPVQPEMLLQVLEEKFREKQARPHVIACIPAYQVDKNIGKVIVQTKPYVDHILVCDDGSTDYTAAIAQGLGATVLRHDRNRGYGAALKTLFYEARKLGTDYIVTLDGDGQHDPSEIPSLIHALTADNADIVIGSRFLPGANHNAPKWREKGIKAITKLAARGNDISDGQSGFRAYNKKALETLVITEDGMGASTEILLKADQIDLKIMEVPVNITYNLDSSTRNPIIHGINVVLSTLKHMSINRPLVFYGIPGFLSLIVAAFFWIMTIQNYTFERTISTNVTLLALSATIVGLMLMTTSIILWVLISVVREKV